MEIYSKSVLLGIGLSLFLGGLGFPIPENPLLIGGGYAIAQQVSPPVISPLFWFLGILCGDLTLYAAVRWLFTRPSLSGLLNRFVRKDKLEKYQETFASIGGWTLFLARFTFGLRALVYIAAGAARYPFFRFMAVDGISVAIQVLIFVGIGYHAGDRVEWAKATADEIAILLTIVVLLTIVLTLGATVIMKKFTKEK